MFGRKCTWGLGGLALIAATPAYAADPGSAGVAPETSAAEAINADDLAIATPIDDNELNELRGGESMTLANQTLVAITSGNVINGDYVAGSVSLSDFSLSNFNGLGNVLINTGAQVSLQTGMNLTINVGP